MKEKLCPACGRTMRALVTMWTCDYCDSVRRAQDSITSPPPQKTHDEMMDDTLFRHSVVTTGRNKEQSFLVDFTAAVRVFAKTPEEAVSKVLRDVFVPNSVDIFSATPSTAEIVKEEKPL